MTIEDDNDDTKNSNNKQIIITITRYTNHDDDDDDDDDDQCTRHGFFQVEEVLFPFNFSHLFISGQVPVTLKQAAAFGVKSLMCAGCQEFMS